MELELPNQLLNGNASAIASGEDKTDEKKNILNVLPERELDEISINSVDSSVHSEEEPPEFPEPCTADDGYSPGTSPQIKIDTKTLGKQK